MAKLWLPRRHASLMIWKPLASMGITYQFYVGRGGVGRGNLHDKADDNIRYGAVILVRVVGLGEEGVHAHTSLHGN